MTQYNVILYKDNHSFESYNILPVFRNVWNSKSYNFKKVEVKTVPNLKEWILNVSRYYFRAKCEYEFLIASWPFGSKNMHDEVMKFFETPKDLESYSTRIDFDNIIIRDMHKIDVHEQIMMNIDIITDILAEEFKIDKQIQAYRLKHIPTGLYFTPSKSGTNLDTRGKVYIDNRNGLNGHSNGQIPLAIGNKYLKYLKEDVKINKTYTSNYIVSSINDFEREYIS
jgi:hypothetical protein